MDKLQNRPLRSAVLIIVSIYALILFCFNVFLVLNAHGLLDFGSFIASGQLANQGENPYTDNSPLIFSVEFQGINHSGTAPNLNPPISVLFFQQIAKFSPMYSLQIWRILIVIIYSWSFYLLIQRNRDKTVPAVFWKALWTFSLAGFWHTIQLGQIYTLLLLLTVEIIINMEKKKNILAGILLGVLIAIKPNFVFWAGALGIAGYWSIFLSAGVTALFISLVPIYFYGFRIYQQWFEASKIFTPDLLIFPGNNSLQGLTARFNSAQAGVVLSIILVVAMLYLIYRYKPSISNINTFSIVTSLLISPIAWTGYTILMLPALLKVKKWKYEHWIAAFIFSFPFYFILEFFQKNFFNFVFWGWFYGWGLLIILVSEIKSAVSSNNL